jgi:alcohol dehydrogenase class IV
MIQAGASRLSFNFATVARIAFGPGTVEEIGRSAAAYGQRALIVTGADASRAQRVADLLASADVLSETLRVPSEPTVELVTEGLAQVHRAKSELVIGVGGGSAIDAAKAIAVLATNDGDPLDFLEVIGKGRTLAKPGLPVIAIPTTAGTGAEVTRNAVLLSPADRVKVSLRSNHILPRLALVDPELSAGMPPEITASSGLDALTQLIEAFTTRRSNAITDGLCREGLRRVGLSILDAYHHGTPRAREDMALASLLSGLALANAGLGAVHGFAGPIGGRYGAPHGAVCAALLPHAMRVNVRAVAAREPEPGILDRYGEIAILLTGRKDASVVDGVEWVKQACDDMAITGLSAFGVRTRELSDLIQAAERSSSMRGNPITLTHGEMQEILESAL